MRPEAIDHDWCLRHRFFYLLFGDLDKPFHQPECECDQCERWREAMGRATHAELRATEDHDDERTSRQH